MSAKSVMIAVVLMSVALFLGTLVWALESLSITPQASADAQAIEAVVKSSQKVSDMAGYTLDAGELPTVYANDSRGGPLPPDAIAYIRAVRPNSTLRADQFGYLDLEQAIIEWRQQHFAAYLTDLRARQAAGTLTPDDLAILAVIDGSQFSPPTAIAAPLTAQSEPIVPTGHLSVPDRHLSLPATPTLVHGYPLFVSRLPLAGPTLTATTTASVTIPYHLPDPNLEPASDYAVTIQTVEIHQDVAWVVVATQNVVSEYVLVKINGQWYIAGGHGIKDNF